MIGCVAILTGLSAGTSPARPMLVFACAARNDAYVAICRSSRRKFARFDAPSEAIHRAPTGAGVLLLAERYPTERTPVPADMMEIAAAKRLRIYVEYPSAWKFGRTSRTTSVLRSNAT